MLYFLHVLIHFIDVIVSKKSSSCMKHPVYRVFKYNRYSDRVRFNDLNKLLLLFHFGLQCFVAIYIEILDEASSWEWGKHDMPLERRFSIAKLSIGVDHWNFTIRPMGDVRGNEISRFNWHSSVRLEGGIEGIEVLSFVSIIHEILKKEEDSWKDYLFYYYIFSESHDIKVYEWKSRATDDGIFFMVGIIASVTTADIILDKMFRIAALWFKFVILLSHQANGLKEKWLV